MSQSHLCSPPPPDSDRIGDLIVLSDQLYELVRTMGDGSRWRVAVQTMEPVCHELALRLLRGDKLSRARALTWNNCHVMRRKFNGAAPAREQKREIRLRRATSSGLEIPSSAHPGE
jgi:hypothetical protein